jgi:hypothetical protein
VGHVLHHLFAQYGRKEFHRTLFGAPFFVRPLVAQVLGAMVHCVQGRLQKYRLVTAWFDALHDIALSELTEDVFEPVYTLIECESNIHWSFDCAHCEHDYYVQRLDWHNMCCEDGECGWCEEIDDCEYCNELNRFNRLFEYCDYHERILHGRFRTVTTECTCQPCCITSDKEFRHLLRRHVPTLREQGWTMVWTYEGKKKIPRLELFPLGAGNDDDVLSCSEELSLLYL